MKKILQNLFEKKSLSKDEAQKILSQIATGEFNDIQIASFLTVFLMRKITVDELIGFRNALYELSLKIDLSDYNLIDLCGTGGDSKNTFNISTLSSFVVAGTGEKVVKHGNYGVSSSCGSSNVLEYLGYEFTNDKDIILKNIEKTNICFLHAPLFHPTMKRVASIRKALAMKTFFNMLGPMINPASPKNQIIGVYSTEIAELYDKIYKKSDMNYVILHSIDGYDEISLTDSFIVKSNLGSHVLNSKYFGFDKIEEKDLYGGNTVKESADIFIKILEGKATEAQNNVVLANSAIAIKCIYPNIEIGECIEKAKDSLFSGKAYQSFKTLVDN